MRAKIRSLEIEIERQKTEIAELNLIIQEMYFYGQDLVERVRMEPIEATELRVASQTSDIDQAKGLRLMKGVDDV